MSSIDIFVDNLNRIAKHYEFKTYREIADYLNVTEDALKHWQNKTRSPSLKKIDEIGDRIKCYTYSLLQKDGDIFAEIEYIKNKSRDVLISNLREYFIQYGRFSWSEKAALFYGFVSEDVLKSYFRAENYRTPPLSKLDEMAEALGKPAYELIKEAESDEKANT
ncbi:MAG: hypothetical protein LUH14_06440 [Clostridiaceae bacterium]|nr:hypothetical protein [Clostridiaceae bacterium]